MKKTKIIALLLIALFAIFAFAACGGDDVGDDVPGVPHDEPDTLDFPQIEPELDEIIEEEAVPMENIDLDNKPIIALTFDDGPNMTNAVLILDELEARGIVATYFVIGGNINDQTAEVMRRAYALGCEYANHSWSWGSMGAMDADDIIKSLTDTSDKIVEVLGEDARPKFFRAPNLNTSAEMLEVVKELGYPLAQGILGNDWEGSATAESIFNLVVPKVEDGSIILLHDGGSNNATAEGIGAILDALLDEGFRFVTLTELFELKGVEPEAGRTYHNAR
ncbi:MAG: polysaccharide deacetylase family protein [Oscillospiraceae bacterium]|nr:polysaccharide deacetylase family protein [Oscillospiraceae bacterium]